MNLKTVHVAIKQLYENENRSIAYIAKLFNVEPSDISEYIKQEQLKPKNIKIKPSTQKFINKNKQFILNELNNGESVKTIAEKLHTTHRILSNAIQKDIHLNKANEYAKRHVQNKTHHYEYPHIDESNEEWKPILGFENYEVSNQGRVRNQNTHKILKPYPNVRTNYLYVMLYQDTKRKNLKVSRLVGHAFVEGYSKTYNTINHKNGNIYDDRVTNLEWQNQSDNNKHAYSTNKRTTNRNGGPKYEKVLYTKDDKTYEFKTVRALAKFLGKSETQAHRMLRQDPNIQAIEKS